ncbi:hypothetical protein SDC9_192786 [bioreactor metagenome]|uniref:Uncharacterized protein n=1 Tax=bioreactor metagenome TaxID=1076179 RepID=A0A645I438_9ZZZZ
MSGFYAEIYKIKADEGFASAQSVIRNRLYTLAKQDILRSYDRENLHNVRIEYKNVTYKHVMLPVWSSVYSYAGKLYHYFVNGETGTVSGKRPYSAVKIGLAITAGLILLTVILLALNGQRV